MRPASYLPLCTALLLLFQFTPPHTHATGLFPWGTQNGDTFAWSDDIHDDEELITLDRPFNFDGRMWGNITVRIILYMSHVVRKLDFCICECKGSDQLHGNREANQHLCCLCTDPSSS